jgi:hypothetical protein
MDISFQWNGTKNLYKVKGYDLTLVTPGAKAEASVPAGVSLVVYLPPEADAGKDFLQYALEQGHKAETDKGGATIYVKPASDKDSIQTIQLSNVSLSNISSGTDEASDRIWLSCTLLPASIDISGVAFEHQDRIASLNLKKKK